jgi:poly(U)-specific endoribonuclease
MADIYQKIWNADQEYAGIKAVASGSLSQAQLDELAPEGYVVVNEKIQPGQNKKLIEKVVIPDSKRESYDRVQALFDNYNLNDWENEENNAEEAQEVQDFLGAASMSPPLAVAREYIEAQSDTPFTDDEWWGLLQRVWMAQYQEGPNKPMVSAFEHIMVGEQKGGTSTVNGYHFWFKYYLDETHGQFGGDMAEVKNLAVASDKTPDCVTLKFEWSVWSYTKNKLVMLTKPKGGFWVGPSAEGMLALGIVRFAHNAFAPKKAEINGFRYNIEMHRSQDGFSLRTLFPVLTGQA